MDIKFRLRIDNKIVGYEKWYGGSFGETQSAKPCWLYSKDGENYSPDYIYHKQKDQYVGRKDENKKDIYGGDIIASSFCPNRKELVEINPYFHSDGWEHLAGIGFSTGMGIDNLEVIANRFENPELLKQIAN